MQERAPNRIVTRESLNRGPTRGGHKADKLRPHPGLSKVAGNRLWLRGDACVR